MSVAVWIATGRVQTSIMINVWWLWWVVWLCIVCINAWKMWVSVISVFMIVMIVWLNVWKIPGKGIGTDRVRMMIGVNMRSIGLDLLRYLWVILVVLWWRVCNGGSGWDRNFRLVTSLRISVVWWISRWIFVFDGVKVIGRGAGRSWVGTGFRISAWSAEGARRKVTCGCAVASVGWVSSRCGRSNEYWWGWPTSIVGGWKCALSWTWRRKVCISVVASWILVKTLKSRGLKWNSLDKVFAQQTSRSRHLAGAFDRSGINQAVWCLSRVQIKVRIKNRARRAWSRRVNGLAWQLTRSISTCWNSVTMRNVELNFVFVIELGHQSFTQMRM